MRIVLFGSAGQVGKVLAPGLAKFGQLTALTRDDLDLVDRKKITETLDRFRPNLIVNAAAYNAVDRAESERELAFQINAEAPRVMAEWSARSNAAFVSYSTDYVFDGSGNEPWKESDQPHPLSAYGESKYAGECHVSESGAAHFMFRTSWVYDATGKNFVTTMAKLGRERVELRVVNDQIGAPTSAGVIAEQTLNVLRMGEKDIVAFVKKNGGVYHLVCRGAVSWYEFAEEVIRGLRGRGTQLTVQRVVPIPSVEYPTPAVRPKNSRLSVEKFESRFHLALPHWKDALTPILDEMTGK